jgi:hypothetical protein
MDYRQSTENTLLRVRSQHRWNSHKVTTWSIAMFFMAMLAYGLFSLLDPGVARPLWFRVSSYLCLILASGASALLCLRNGNSPKMPSGRLVWQLLGWGSVAGTIAQILALIWEQFLSLRPDISPADPFFIGFYVMFALALGILISRQKITLNWPQGILLFCLSAVAVWVATKIVDTATTVVPLPNPNAHPWGLLFVQSFQYLANSVSIFYVFADVMLVVMAAILSMGFWGGRLATAWQVMAQGLFCICVADIWFAFLAKSASYRSGDPMELFWLAGLLQLSIAAALEWENAHRVQRLIRR